MSRRLLLLLPFLLACHREPQSDSGERGRQLVTQYGCNVCHVVPGVAGTQGVIGPSLAGFASRPAFSHGTIPNTPENVARFIVAPASLNPASAMPPLNVPPADAQALAAYLATLR